MFSPLEATGIVKLWSLLLHPSGEGDKADNYDHNKRKRAMIQDQGAVKYGGENH